MEKGNQQPKNNPEKIELPSSSLDEKDNRRRENNQEEIDSKTTVNNQKFEFDKEKQLRNYIENIDYKRIMQEINEKLANEGFLNQQKYDIEKKYTEKYDTEKNLKINLWDKIRKLFYTGIIGGSILGGGEKTEGSPIKPEKSIPVLKSESEKNKLELKQNEKLPPLSPAQKELIEAHRKLFSRQIDQLKTKFDNDVKFLEKKKMNSLKEKYGQKIITRSEGKNIEYIDLHLSKEALAKITEEMKIFNEKIAEERKLFEAKIELIKAQFELELEELEKQFREKNKSK